MAGRPRLLETGVGSGFTRISRFGRPLRSACFSTSEPICLIVDSSGLKICGLGEWHSKKRGQKSRRKSKKLHIGVDDEGWIRTSLVTDGHTQDPTVVPELLEQLDVAVKPFVADGIHDNGTVYGAIAE